MKALGRVKNKHKKREKMKKLPSLFLAAAIAASTLAADELRSTVYIGAASSSIENENMTEAVFGFGGDKIYDSGFIMGFHSEYSYGSVEAGSSNDKSRVSTIEADLKGGYSPFKNFSVFALVAGAGQYIESDAAYGFGYGAGMDYALTESIILDVRYKTYSMKDALLDYDYDKAVVSLRYKL